MSQYVTVCHSTLPSSPLRSHPAYANLREFWYKKGGSKLFKDPTEGCGDDMDDITPDAVEITAVEPDTSATTTTPLQEEVRKVEAVQTSAAVVEELQECLDDLATKLPATSTGKPLQSVGPREADDIDDQQGKCNSWQTLLKDNGNSVNLGISGQCWHMFAYEII